jgi:hypothetical protein
MAKDWNRIPMEDAGFADQEARLLAAVEAHRADSEEN